MEAQISPATGATTVTMTAEEAAHLLGLLATSQDSAAISLVTALEKAEGEMGG